MLEDALRVATLPGAESGRLVLIRRIDLGRIAPDATSSTLALQLERRCRDLPCNTAGKPAATGPDTVVFADRSHAVLALAQRLANDVSAPEWFWPLAIPGYRTGTTRAMAWRVLLRAVLADPAAPVVAAQFVQCLLASGRLGECIDTLSPTDVPALYAACRWTVPVAPSPAPPAVVAPAAATTKRHPPSWARDAAWVTSSRLFLEQRPTPPEPVRIWILSLLAVRVRSALAADAGLPETVARWLGAVPFHARSLASPSCPPAEAIASGIPASVRQEPPDEKFAPSPPVPEIPHDFPRRTQAAVSFPAAATDAARGESTVPTSAPSTPHDSTAFGGLLFMVPLLTRLGFVQWLHARPDLLAEDFASDLMLELGRRCGMQANDPLAFALLALPVADRAILESRWARLVQDPRDSPAMERRAWIRSLRTFCRRHAAIGLASIIRRPARIDASPTHLELRLDLTQVDLRIRRAGLDLDPGWVPWLGRVIRFHYLDRHDA